MTVDLRVAGRAAREASVEAARELASVGVAGAEGLHRIRLERAKIESAEGRLAAARADRVAAYACFEELAPGRLPSEVETIAAELEAELAAQAEADETARAKAEPVAQAEVVPEAPAPKAEWWFTPQKAPAAPPDPAPPAPVRALAERLSAEGREALARVEAQLAALDRVELAKKSLEWHEAHSAPEKTD
jgi:hypothetical protein